jgi:hypothetical protein
MRLHTASICERSQWHHLELRLLDRLHQAAIKGKRTKVMKAAIDPCPGLDIIVMYEILRSTIILSAVGCFLKAFHLHFPWYHIRVTLHVLFMALSDVVVDDLVC